MNKIILPVLGVVAIGAGAFGVVQMNSASALQTNLAELNARLTQLEKDRDLAMQQRAKALADAETAMEDIARLKKERDDAKARAKEMAENAEKNHGIANAPANPAAPGDRPQIDMRNMAQGFFKSIDNPDVRKAMKSGQERMINGAYGSLFKKLGLDEATSKLATELISDRNMAALEKGRKIAEAGGSEAAIAEARKEIAAVKTEYDSKLKSVLGDQGFGEFNSYEQTVGDQRTLRGISRNFEEKGVPLQPGQQETLTSIMRDVRLENPSNDIPDLGGGPGMAVLMSDEEARVKQQQEEMYQEKVKQQMAAKGFTPDQVNAINDSFKQQNEARTMGRAMGRMFLGGGAGGGSR